MDSVTAAAQAASLEALAVTVSQCNACGLCTEREQVVLGQGVMQPAIMVIGEGPGDQEDRQGLPFVGTTGVLLDNMLLSIGSSRQSDVYMTNIVKCRPPSNRNPRPAEIAACRPFLLRQIELVRPFSILAVGRFAAQTLVGGEALLEDMRDKPFSISHAGLNIPVVVSYHPGHLLRHPSDKAAAWRDLQRARALGKGL
jgi:DNA polymerase